MIRRLTWLLLLAGCSAPAAGPPGGQEAVAAQPRYTEAGELRRPEGWEDWVLVGTSLGLGYSEGARREEPGDFHRVFLAPAAYAEYARTGTFPEKAMLALVLNEARQRESIARQGYFAGDFLALEVAVKDGEKFPEGWAYFDFGKERPVAAAKPREACYNCHLEHGTDNVFVQFYPRLQEPGGTPTGGP